jgi:hypothetical protein
LGRSPVAVMRIRRLGRCPRTTAAIILSVGGLRVGLFLAKGQELAQPSSAFGHVVQDEGIAEHPFEGVNVSDRVAPLAQHFLELRECRRLRVLGFRGYASPAGAAGHTPAQARQPFKLE